MIYVPYHASCPDGFGAAYAAYQRFGKTAQYLPVQYGQDLPEMPRANDVYVLDFSFPAAVLDELSRKVLLIVLDHHATAQADLAGKAYARFDLTKSGAILAWEYFHDEPPPILLQYVQDRDLWRWELPASRAVSAGLATYPYDFREWDRLVSGGIRMMDMLAREGETIIRYQERQLDRIVRQARIQTIAGYAVPTVNATTLVSEVGEALLAQYPEAPFSASYRVRAEGKVSWSLRARPTDDLDVGEIARTFGGGGHPKAAGFETTGLIPWPS